LTQTNLVMKAGGGVGLRVVLAGLLVPLGAVLCGQCEQLTLHLRWLLWPVRLLLLVLLLTMLTEGAQLPVDVRHLRASLSSQTYQNGNNLGTSQNGNLGTTGILSKRNNDLGHPK
jgi:hypothetical protein